MSRGRTKQCFFVIEREKEVQEWNEQKMLEALPGNSGGRLPGRSTKRKAERKESQMRAERKDKFGAKSLKKWLRASRRGQARMKMPSRPHKEQLGNMSSKVGTVLNSKTKRRKNMTGKKRTRWKCNGLRMKSWKRFWNDEERMEFFCRPELAVHERMSQC